MRVSTKGRYGLRLLLDLALHGTKGEPRMLQEIAASQNISKKYLSQLVIKLRQGGLISSVRGAGGGYKLARPPKMITIMDVLETMEGPIAIVDCLADSGSCERSGRCPPQMLWSQINQKVRNVLMEYTLQDLLELQHICGFNLDSERVT